MVGVICVAVAATAVVDPADLDARDMLLASGGAGRAVICGTGRGFARDGEAHESAARTFADTFRELFTGPAGQATRARRRRAGVRITTGPAALPHAGVQRQAQCLVALIAGADDAARAVAVSRFAQTARTLPDARVRCPASSRRAVVPAHPTQGATCPCRFVKAQHGRPGRVSSDRASCSRERQNHHARCVRNALADHPPSSTLMWPHLHPERLRHARRAGPADRRCVFCRN